MLSLLALLACQTGPDATLPASALPMIEARRVTAGVVQGYLARPIDRSRSWPGVLMQVEQLDPDTLGLARSEAEKGSITLAIDAHADAGASLEYLRGLPSVRDEPRVLCLREVPACVSTGP